MGDCASFRGSKIKFIIGSGQSEAVNLNRYDRLRHNGGQKRDRTRPLIVGNSRQHDASSRFKLVGKADAMVSVVDQKEVKVFTFEIRVEPRGYIVRTTESEMDARPLTPKMAEAGLAEFQFGSAGSNCGKYVGINNHSGDGSGGHGLGHFSFFNFFALFYRFHLFYLEPR